MKKKNRIWINSFLILAFVITLTNSCKKETENMTLPVLTTASVSNITEKDAICGGDITSEGNSKIITRGICWSTNSTPTIADNKTIDSIGIGSYISQITGLITNTQYYVRAYATNSGGTGYGNVISFTTKLVVTDIDGNIYHTVTIGTQVWMVENLKVSHYRNGDSIPNVTFNDTWRNLSTGAYCNQNNTDSFSMTYGRLYNWYVVNDSRKIAPTGWHVPSDAEWTILTDYLGGKGIAGGKIKEKGTTHWKNPNTDATNETGFTALPGGYRYVGDQFYPIGDDGHWWSSTKGYPNCAYYRYISNFNSAVFDNDGGSYKCGFSIRCIKD